MQKWVQFFFFTAPILVDNELLMSKSVFFALSCSRNPELAGTINFKWNIFYFSRLWVDIEHQEWKSPSCHLWFQRIPQSGEIGPKSEIWTTGANFRLVNCIFYHANSRFLLFWLLIWPSTRRSPWTISPVKMQKWVRFFFLTAPILVDNELLMSKSGFFGLSCSRNPELAGTINCKWNIFTSAVCGST